MRVGDGSQLVREESVRPWERASYFRALLAFFFSFFISFAISSPADGRLVAGDPAIIDHDQVAFQEDPCRAGANVAKYRGSKTSCKLPRGGPCFCACPARSLLEEALGACTRKPGALCE